MYLVSNSLSLARQGAVISHSHSIGKGIEALSIEISGWEVVGSRIEPLFLAFFYHPTLSPIISPTAPYAP